MLLLAITLFTTKEIYSKNSCNYNIFFVKVTHLFLFIHTKLKLKCYKKALQSIQHTFNLHWYFSKVNLCSVLSNSKYKLGYVKHGSTAFKVQKDGCGVPSVARALLGEGL